MEFDHDDVRPGDEDRLSSLPDELIHKILSPFDMKFVVQTCLLSSRWKLLWTSMPCLNFSTEHFYEKRNIAKFMTYVLSHRNHKIDVSSVKLHINGATNRVFVRTIANYAFSHNVQELTVISDLDPYGQLANYLPCLFSSQSLKHFTLTIHYKHYSTFRSNYMSLKTCLDFPSLTTLHLSRLTLCRDLFSKCVNLKNLTLADFFIKAEAVLDIITPRLSNLILIYGSGFKVINVIAPQLENLTIYCCSIECLNAPPGLSSLCYTGSVPWQLSNYRFHSLNKVTICLLKFWWSMVYEKEDARIIINILQDLHSVRYLTLDAGIVECISSFPDLLSQHSSPFSNLICLTIDPNVRKNAYRVNLSSEARKFLLENSPSATLIMKLPKGC